MFRIRRIHDDVLPINRQSIAQVQALLTEAFAEVAAREGEALAEKLRNPFKQQFRSILLVAENGRGRVLGFALLMVEPRLKFCYLDFIATAQRSRSGGIGASLYEQVRGEALALGASALFFECLPDDLEGCPEPALIDGNRARLRFYERYNARPIIGTAYETPVRPADTCLPHLDVR